MRGNDVLQGTPDIMVTDSLTGNIMVKMLSFKEQAEVLKQLDTDTDQERRRI